MVTRRARSLFAILLAFALLPIGSMAVAGAVEARAHAARAWMQSNARSQTAVQAAREPGDASAHHPDAAPFTAAEAFHHGLSAPIAATAPATPRAFAAGAPITLHPARAPPALL